MAQGGRRGAVGRTLGDGKGGRNRGTDDAVGVAGDSGDRVGPRWLRATTACALAIALAVVNLGAACSSGSSVSGASATSGVALGSGDVPDDLGLCHYSGSVPE